MLGCRTSSRKRWQGRRGRLTRRAAAKARAVEEEQHAAGVGGAHDTIYAGVPFRQWLSPNGQWRVRPIRFRPQLFMRPPGCMHAA